MKIYIYSVLLVIFLSADYFSSAQQAPIQYLRPNDKNGLNFFETTKKDTVIFTGLKVRIGGNFTQDFQMLSHKNSATPVTVNNVNTNELIKLTSGFNLAMANLRVDAQLYDGIRLSLTTYLSSRHHEESWVKGGYIQFDKLVFMKSDFINHLMDYLTIKVGDFTVDYGDQHFRRTDGGNTIYNPFVENYIMDEFATEIGGEIYFHDNGFLLMGGITNGLLNPSVVAPAVVDSSTGQTNYYSPAFHGKIGYDKQVNTSFRVRITGSIYTNKSGNNTLFFGDRTGSHYFLVLENSTATPVTNAWSGRLNPLFTQQVTTFMINPFLKYGGLEFFGTYEQAEGRIISEKSQRTDIQYAGDLIFRFGATENFWVGVRYDMVKAELPGYPNKVNIDREVGSVGWFLTENIMLKVEYVTQQYKDFLPADIRNGGKFDGTMVEASVAF